MPDTETITPETMKLVKAPTATELAVIVETAFDISEADIDALADELLSLKVFGPEDTEGAATCHAGRMKLVKLRTTIDKTRKDKTARYREAVTALNAVGNHLIGLIKPIEEHLQFQEDTVKREQERLAKEAKEAAAKELNRRQTLLLEVGRVCPVDVLEGMTVDEFEAAYADTKADHDAKQAELAEAEAARKAESDRLDAVAKEQEAKQCELHALQAELDAKAKAEAQRVEAEASRVAEEHAAKEADLAKRQKAIEDAEREAQRKVDQANADEAARVKAEAAAKAKAEAAELKRIADEKQAAADAKTKEVERKRIEAAAPDRDKIEAYALAVVAIDLPKLSKASRHQQNRVEEVRATFIERVRSYRDECGKTINT